MLGRASRLPVAQYINKLPIQRRFFFQTLTQVPNMFVSEETCSRESDVRSWFWSQSDT